MNWNVPQRTSAEEWIAAGEAPSRFLRGTPTRLQVEGGEPPCPRARRNDQVVSHAESLKEELSPFHDCVAGGRRPLTSGEDALCDTALCEAVVDAHLARRARQQPTDAAASRSRIAGGG